MTSPSLSAVIPAYNAAATIRSAVGSALNQARACLEVIVVDDGSTDATAEVVEQITDPRVRLISRPNGGPSAARNAGIAAARADYVGFLDSDDLWLPTYVERAIAGLSATRRPGFAYTDAYVFDGASGRVRRETAMDAPDPPPSDQARFLLALLRRNFVFTAAAVPAGVLAAVSGYNERLAMSEEYDLWLRILIAGYEPVWLGGPLALYREHPGQSSRQILAMKRTAAEVYAGLKMDDMPSQEHRRALAERRQAAEREVAVVAGTAGSASVARRMRNQLGRLRKRAGLTHSWYPVPPPEVSEAFGDLSRVDQILGVLSEGRNL
jgi:glycosyltransferase involved in cell wall biosynthesis